MSHYFKYDDKTISNEVKTTLNINNVEIRLTTDRGVFSYSEVDYGSKLLIETVVKHEDFLNKVEVIDLGCGYGPIGLALKKKYPHINLTAVDVNQRAIELMNKNLVENNLSATTLLSDFFENVSQNEFDVVISNPPIRIGKQKLFEMYQESYKKLVDQGKLWIVVRKKQGALSHVEYLKSIYKEVNILNRSKGYFIITAVK